MVELTPEVRAAVARVSRTSLNLADAWVPDSEDERLASLACTDLGLPTDDDIVTVCRDDVLHFMVNAALMARLSGRRDAIDELVQHLKANE